MVLCAITGSMKSEKSSDLPSQRQFQAEPPQETFSEPLKLFTLGPAFAPGRCQHPRHMGSDARTSIGGASMAPWPPNSSMDPTKSRSCTEKSSASGETCGEKFGSQIGQGMRMRNGMTPRGKKQQHVHVRFGVSFKANKHVHV